MKKIEVDISQCLSSLQTIEVPDDYEYDPVTLEKYVREQVILPLEVLEKAGDYNWYVDDFCII